MINELVSTIVVFVASKNREIVKSALGFVKVAVVSLPAETMRPHLPTLVPALLGWVHDHKNHFKTKTVHIFERMIRKFGYEAVYSQGGEGDRKKVLENIKKKKDRAKRQKANRAAGSDEEEEDTATRKVSTGSAFEDALYGSDSEDEETGAPSSRAKPAAENVKGRKDKRNAAYIQEDADEPMDLLDRSIAARVTSEHKLPSDPHFSVADGLRCSLSTSSRSVTSSSPSQAWSGGCRFQAGQGDGQDGDRRGIRRGGRSCRQCCWLSLPECDDLGGRYGP
jgi:ribosomal RNA-processing protein 12